MWLYNLLIDFANWAWGIPMLIFLIGGGTVLTIAIGGIQITRLKFIFKHTLWKNKDKAEDKETRGITGFQALTATLSTTLGTGNIMGVGIAIAMGGPGAVFWMWVIGLIACAIKYAEAVLAVHFREKEEGTDEYKAGAFMYIKKGLETTRFAPLAKPIAWIYGIWLLVALLIPGAVHSAGIADSLATLNVPRFLSVGVSVLVVILVVYGGLKRIVNVTERLVPLMSIIYMSGGLIVMLLNYKNIIPAILLIFSDAFTGTSAVGGFIGSTAAMTMRWGMSRGIYSSDSGTGIAATLHGQAKVKHPVEQGFWGVLEVFFDTIVICTFTAFTILVSGVWQGDITEGATYIAYAFADNLGIIGQILVVLSTFLFAISTVITVAYYIEKQARVMWGKTAGKSFQAIFVIGMLVGSKIGITALVPLVDVAYAFTIFFNVGTMFILIKLLHKITKDYFDKIKSGELK